MEMSGFSVFQSTVKQIKVQEIICLKAKPHHAGRQLAGLVFHFVFHINTSFTSKVI